MQDARRLSNHEISALVMKVLIGTFVVAVFLTFLCFLIGWLHGVLHRRMHKDAEMGMTVVKADKGNTQKTTDSVEIPRQSDVELPKQSRVIEPKFGDNRMEFFEVERCARGTFEVKPLICTTEDGLPRGYVDEMAVSNEDITTSLTDSSMSQSGNSNGFEVCWKCDDAPARIIFIPCSHGGLCERCTRVMQQSSKTCPQCQGCVSRILRIHRMDLLNKDKATIAVAIG